MLNWYEIAHVEIWDWRDIEIYDRDLAGVALRYRTFAAELLKETEVFRTILHVERGIVCFHKFPTSEIRRTPKT